MTRAFVCGCAGTALSEDERTFVRDARPWGLILFKRNVADREQLRALTDAFRETLGRDDAPVLDVADPLTHAVIGSRSYSQSPERVAAFGRAVMEGLLAGGVAPVIKHVPGHGRARVDSHLELPVVAGRPGSIAV